ncbi:hypothetical protein [Streptomyces sp. NPDC007172]|uniref:hypothetical protein n=1 Tax=Streptomyces sp. NPDC007172 TaxID=3364776 RepID=UPI0036AAD88C
MLTPNLCFRISTTRLARPARPKIRAHLPRELGQLGIVPDLGIVSVTALRYEVCGSDFYTEAPRSASL